MTQKTITKVTAGGQVQLIMGAGGENPCTVTSEAGAENGNLVRCISDRSRGKGWYHIAFTLDTQKKAPQAKVLLNGSIVGISPIPRNCVVVPAPASVPLADAIVLGPKLHGEIAEVRYWGGVRKEDNIEAGRMWALELASKEKRRVVIRGKSAHSEELVHIHDIQATQVCSSSVCFSLRMCFVLTDRVLLFHLLSGSLLCICLIST
eukprot:g2626.t1